MKSLARTLVLGLALAALGAASLTAGVVERRLADAEQALASFDFVGTAAAYEALDRSLWYAQYVSWITDQAVDSVEARRAAVSYWAGDYEPLLAVMRAASAGEARDVDLLFIAANAVYRLGVERAGTREAILRSVDDARAGYQTVLRESERHTDAAFNYEYLGIIRDEIASGGRGVLAGPAAAVDRTTPARHTLHGREGAPPAGPPNDDFNIYVPEEPDEGGKGVEPGGDELRRRKG